MLFYAGLKLCKNRKKLVLSKKTFNFVEPAEKLAGTKSQLFPLNKNFTRLPALIYMKSESYFFLLKNILRNVLN